MSASEQSVMCSCAVGLGRARYHGLAAARELSAGWITWRIAGLPVKSALEKIPKNNQRRHANQPHPVLEFETGDGVVVEQKSRDLIPHTAIQRSPPPDQ